MRNDSDDFMELEDLQRDLAAARSLVNTQQVAELINVLQESLEKAQESQEGRKFFDEKLGENISQAISKLAETIKTATPQPPDLSGLIKANEKSQKAISAVISEISAQNEKLIAGISKLADRPTNDSGYQAVIQEVLSVVKKSNELLLKGAKQIDYTAALERLADRPKRWKFQVQYLPGGSKKIDNIVATAEEDTKK